jgi:DNA-directed RNA polymerase specialized sigma24 family protein
MLPEGSITHLILSAKRGDESAMQGLWDRCFQRMMLIARAKLQDSPRRVADEEDIVLTALNGFFEGARQGRFPQLKDRSSLWPLLTKITMRKAISQRARERTASRGGGRIRGDSVFAIDDDSYRGIEAAIAKEITAEFADEVCISGRELLERLDDDVLRLVARRKLEGYLHAEIAKELGCSKRTIDRKLDHIRRVWRSLLDP